MILNGPIRIILLLLSSHCCHSKKTMRFIFLNRPLIVIIISRLSTIIIVLIRPLIILPLIILISIVVWVWLRVCWVIVIICNGLHSISVQIISCSPTLHNLHLILMLATLKAADTDHNKKNNCNYNWAYCPIRELI